MGYKMLFLDLDDTLLSSDLSISEENLDAIRRASEIGVKVIICTGRGIFSVQHIAEKLKIEWNNCYIICLNGGAVYKGFPPVLIKERLFDNKSASLIYDTAKKYGVDIQIYRDDMLILDNISERVQMYIEKLKPKYILIDSIADYDGEIAKVLLSGSNDILLKIEKELNPKLKGKYNIFLSNPNYLEFTACGTTKGEAMAELSEIIGVDLSQTIAIGDSFNDMSMIQTAGLGVAVRNAVEPLKLRADYITKSTHDENAVAEVIDRFIFNKGKVSKNIYKFRFPVMIFIIILIIEQLLASAFGLSGFKIVQYLYINGEDILKFNVLSFIIPIILCFVVDFFNQKTRCEDEEEFWESKYGKKNI